MSGEIHMCRSDWSMEGTGACVCESGGAFSSPESSPRLSECTPASRASPPLAETPVKGLSCVWPGSRAEPRENGEFRDGFSRQKRDKASKLSPLLYEARSSKRVRRPPAVYEPNSDRISRAEDPVLAAALKRSKLETKNHSLATDPYVPLIPTITLEEEEFSNPIVFLEKYKHLGLKYGAVKVIPPKSFQPKFSLNLKNLKFEIREQKINRLNHGDTFTHPEEEWSIQKLNHFDNQFEKILRNKFPHHNFPHKISQSDQLQHLENLYWQIVTGAKQPQNEPPKKKPQKNTQSYPQNPPPEHPSTLSDPTLSPPIETETLEVGEIKGSKNAGKNEADENAEKSQADKNAKNHNEGVKNIMEIQGNGEKTEKTHEEMTQKTQEKITETTGKTQEEITEKIAESEENVLDMKVVYAADLRTDLIGSGFPREGDFGDHAWNLQNLPNCAGSLLRPYHLDVPGVTSPWLYLGMLFSSFCWHTEDNYFASANYQHFGASKVWYIIPPGRASGMERLLRSYLSDRSAEYILHSLTIQLPPSLLLANNIPVYKAVQNPNEFIMLWPRAYHGGFNAGLNCNEACNIAPAFWLPWGSRAVQAYRYLRPTCIPHDQILLFNCFRFQHHTPDRLFQIVSSLFALLHETLESLQNSKLPVFPLLLDQTAKLKLFQHPFYARSLHHQPLTRITLQPHTQNSPNTKYQTKPNPEIVNQNIPKNEENQDEQKNQEQKNQKRKNEEQKNEEKKDEKNKEKKDEKNVEKNEEKNEKNNEKIDGGDTKGDRCEKMEENEEKEGKDVLERLEDICKIPWKECDNCQSCCYINWVVCPHSTDIMCLSCEEAHPCECNTKIILARVSITELSDILAMVKTHYTKKRAEMLKGDNMQRRDYVQNIKADIENSCLKSKEGQRTHRTAKNKGKRIKTEENKLAGGGNTPEEIGTPNCAQSDNYFEKECPSISKWAFPSRKSLLNLEKAKGGTLFAEALKKAEIDEKNHKKIPKNVQKNSPKIDKITTPLDIQLVAQNTTPKNEGDTPLLSSTAQGKKNTKKPVTIDRTKVPQKRSVGIQVKMEGDLNVDDQIDFEHITPSSQNHISQISEKSEVPRTDRVAKTEGQQKSDQEHEQTFPDFEHSEQNLLESEENTFNSENNLPSSEINPNNSEKNSINSEKNSNNSEKNSNNSEKNSINSEKYPLNSEENALNSEKNPNNSAEDPPELEKNPPSSEKNSVKLEKTSPTKLPQEILPETITQIIIQNQNSSVKQQAKTLLLLDQLMPTAQLEWRERGRGVYKVGKNGGKMGKHIEKMGRNIGKMGKNVETINAENLIPLIKTLTRRTLQLICHEEHREDQKGRLPMFKTLAR